MKIYLASRFRTAATVRALAGKLREAGHIITSTWHDIEATPAGLVPYSDPGHEDHARLAALRDMDQIQAADVFVILTEDCERAPAGLWFEMGVAYDKCMDCYILGPKVNIFCCLPRVKQFAEEAALLEELDFQARFLYRASPARPPAVAEDQQ